MEMEELLTIVDAELRDLKATLARERARLDWWASRTLNSCVRVKPADVGALNERDIRASIDSHRRRELAHERNRSTRSRTATDEQPSPRRGPGRRMDETGLIHLAGPIAGQVQKCVRCDAILADSRGAQQPEGQGEGPRGWMEGPVTFYGVQGGFRIAGRQSDAVDCIWARFPWSA